MKQFFQNTWLIWLNLLLQLAYMVLLIEPSKKEAAMMAYLWLSGMAITVHFVMIAFLLIFVTKHPNILKQLKISILLILLVGFSLCFAMPSISV